MNKHYPVIIEQDRDGVFIVECPILKSCRSYGNTIVDALENIQEAIAVCLLEEPEPAENDIVFIGVRDLELAVS
jgi:predicted RNase H-like HicB family nuclease